MITALELGKKVYALSFSPVEEGGNLYKICVNLDKRRRVYDSEWETNRVCQT